MQAELAAQFPEVEETYAQASEELGFDLWQLARVFLISRMPFD